MADETLTKQEIETFRQTLSDLQGVATQIAELKSLGGAVVDLKAKQEKIAEVATQIAELKQMRERFEALEARSARIGMGGGTGEYTGSDPHERKLWAARNTPRHAERKAAFLACVRKRMDERALSDMERKDLVIADDPQAGYLVYDELVTDIIEPLREFDKIRANATVRTGAAPRLTLPKRTANAVGGWAGEAPGTYTEDTTLAYGQVNIDAYKATIFIDLSEELLEDAFVDLEAEIRRQFVEALADLEGVAFVTGNGVTRPAGFMVDALVQANHRHQGEAAAITDGDAIVQLQTDLPEPYWSNARYYLNRSTYGTILTVKTGIGQFLFNLQTAALPTILAGREIVLSKTMPDIAANAYPIAYGDLRRGYVIYDRRGLMLQRDPYSQMTTGLVRFAGSTRVGGHVIDDDAIRTLLVAV